VIDAPGRRGLTLLLLVVVVVVAVAWVGLGGLTPSAAPLPSGDPTNGVTITNATDSGTFTIVYEAPDGTIERLVDLPPAQHAVIDSIFAEREGLCRTGRLVALFDGTEIDELYLVCRGRTWTIQKP
jgi:hypothetical protein